MIINIYCKVTVLVPTGMTFVSSNTPLGSTFTYTCKTVAVSADGNTVLSDPVSSTFTLHSNPSPVTNLVAMGLDQSISLSWNASVTNGFPIQKYSIRNSSNVELFNTTSTQYLITGLTNGIAQTYKIVAVTQSYRNLGTNNYNTIEFIKEIIFIST